MGDYNSKKIVVVGAGNSGCSLARFFCQRGAKVVLSDSRSEEYLDGLKELKNIPISFDLGGHTESLFQGTDLIVVSPGVPVNLPVLEKARGLGIPIAGEIEIAWQELQAPLVGITGTNGKSTVTTLMGEIFKCWGKQTFVGGNLGKPLITAVDDHWDWLVVELSSFQLETIHSFHPKYGVMLNITEDHLDRYPNMDAYINAKARLFENMTSDDIAVLNADDPLVAKLRGQVKARPVMFSGAYALRDGMSFNGGEIHWHWRGETLSFPVEELQISGRHNIENVMAALIPPLLEGCPADLAWETVKLFQGLPHRMEVIGARNGCRWIDDSKGTNIGSVVKSLSGLKAPVTLIAGGKDKQGDLEPLREAVATKVNHLILIGEAAERMAKAFEDITEIHKAINMVAAVHLADKITAPGSTVLLSPGCSSFDMFKSYEDRGKAFTEAFKALDVARGC
ncbi:MAG: UDP-N-acetylmuramoyl-L-alanine--D-glutamate ligase [Deltaproteobacteria bacterium]|jgi:UDP-N-acetylmuramoylalanine--D-glutamate ligase|nr:UDP-N-acetylmuramoyl-L-alanine--D-glutamate ligase [Deltaproteobacteria bacterium]MBW2519784.1 UDP-N-acetylmuramoyl-L-alanine--D-glutamate ligase [Deltaproteobacteria bacterium]